MKEIIINGEEFYVLKSNRKFKKYDVFDSNKKYILSFGDKRYKHFKDLIGEYSNLDHGDEKRRKRYLKRALGINKANNPHTSNFWSVNFLW